MCGRSVRFPAPVGCAAGQGAPRHRRSRPRVPRRAVCAGDWPQRGRLASMCVSADADPRREPPQTTQARPPPLTPPPPAGAARERPAACTSRCAHVLGEPGPRTLDLRGLGAGRTSARARNAHSLRGVEAVRTANYRGPRRKSLLERRVKRPTHPGCAQLLSTPIARPLNTAPQRPSERRP
jgi:hypothetical protein